ncbi:MAG TPA: hypothetical protein DEO49_06030 [Sutterella sp.]|nr:hypothetical protein [Sutterella sp.]
MSSLLYVLVFVILPVFCIAYAARSDARREHNEEVIRAAEEKALAEACARHEAEYAAAKAAEPKRKRGRPRKNPPLMPAEAITQRPATISEPPKAAPIERPEFISAAPVVVERPASTIAPHGNNVFAGETVAFTGALPDMTRREAVEAVQRNGGKAFDEAMPVGTTILVVGDDPGRDKLDEADKRIEQVRKITPERFFEMLRRPLCLELDEFAALYAAELNAHNNTRKEA